VILKNGWRCSQQASSASAHGWSIPLHPNTPVLCGPLRRHALKPRSPSPPRLPSPPPNLPIHLRPNLAEKILQVVGQAPHWCVRDSHQLNLATPSLSPPQSPPQGGFLLLEDSGSYTKTQAGHQRGANQSASSAPPRRPARRRAGAPAPVLLVPEVRSVSLPTLLSVPLPSASQVRRMITDHAPPRRRRSS
jgi:hypothetical protein